MELERHLPDDASERPEHDHADCRGRGAVLVRAALILGVDWPAWSGTVNLGAALVAGFVAGAVLYFRIKLARRQEAETVWHSEHAAQKARGDRLQREKDELGNELVACRVRVAELENRPSMDTLEDLIRTQAGATTEMSATLMQMVTQHDQHAMDAMGHVMSTLRELAAEMRTLVQVLGAREQRVRRDDPEE